MSVQKEAVLVLRETERRLRELVGRAAEAGQYAEAVHLAALAQAVAELAGTAEPGGGQGGEPQFYWRHFAPTATGPAPRIPAARGARSARAGRKAPSPAKQRPAGAYPRFYREGDRLVKVAWSKKRRTEYQHRATWRVCQLVAQEIEARAGGGVFTSDDLIPLRDPQDKREVPSYQVYAVLAWFREAGLIAQHGRRGYTVRTPDLTAAVQQAWAELCEPAE